MNLNLFLLFLRRPMKGKTPKAPGLWIKLARKILPASIFSDSMKGKAGILRRILKQIGPVTQSSPLRRVIQAVCFVLFLILFFHTCWPYSAQPDAEAVLRTAEGEAWKDASGRVWPAHYTLDREAKEPFYHAELFLILDPLVAITTAIAAKAWVWSLIWAAGMLLVCVLFPRGFCGYLCPLGTLIDIFDWAIGKRVNLFKVKGDGWWIHLKYYVLLGTLVAGLFGILLSGFVAAIPVITRGLLFILAPLQMGLGRDWHQVPPLNAGHYVSIVLFLAVLGLGGVGKLMHERCAVPTKQGEEGKQALSGGDKAREPDEARRRPPQADHLK